MRSSVNIVVTCTNQKTRPAEKGLRFRGIRDRSIEDRAAKWIRRLAGQNGTRIAARDLYCGEHWSVVRNLEEAASAKGLHSRIWICSTGYGIVRMIAPIASYDATFSTGHSDSVLRRVTPILVRRRRCEWWKLISSWVGPEPGEPRSIEEIVSRSPRTPLLVVGSPSYLQAIEADLMAAARRLHDRDRMFIVSAGMEEFGELTDCLLPCDARLQTLVGGSLHSLSARVAHKIIAESHRWPLDARLHRRYEDLLKRQPEVTMPKRKPMSDEAVKALISDALKKQPAVKHTPLLRKLRDEGWACEQKRFASLYREVREVLDGC